MQAERQATNSVSRLWLRRTERFCCKCRSALEMAVTMELIAPIRYVNTVMPDTMQNMETRRSGVLVALMSPYLQAASALDLGDILPETVGAPKARIR